MLKNDSSLVGDTNGEIHAISNPERARILARLRADRYSTAEGEGRDDVDRWHRASWNAGINHAIAIVSQGSVVEGLRELVEARPQLPRHWLAEHFAGIGGCSCRAGVVSCSLHDGPVIVANAASKPFAFELDVENQEIATAYSKFLGEGG